MVARFPRQGRGVGSIPACISFLFIHLPQLVLIDSTNVKSVEFRTLAGPCYFSLEL